MEIPVQKPKEATPDNALLPKAFVLEPFEYWTLYIQYWIFYSFFSCDPLSVGFKSFDSSVSSG